MDQIFGNLEIQIKNLSLLLGGTATFDDIDDVEKQIIRVPGNLLNLHENSAADIEKLSIIDELKPEDVASVVFAKIALYCDIISKCTNTAKNKLLGE